MKIIKIDKTSMSLDQSIYEKIVDEFGSQMNIVRHINKDQNSVHTTLRVAASIRDIAEKIATKCPRFASKAEVDRAAYYMGMMLIYQLVKDPAVQRDECGIMFNSLLAEEKSMVSLDMLDTVTEAVKRLSKAYEKRILSRSEFEKKVETLISYLPDELQEIAAENCDRVLHGENISNIINKRTKGRPRIVPEDEY